MTELENLRQRIIALEKSENELRLIETELRKTQAHLQSLIESPSNFAVYRFVHDPENPYLLKVLYVSPSVKEILGISDPSRFESLYEIIHPDDLERFIAANLKAFETKRFNESFRIFHSEKQEWRWIQGVSTEAFDDEEKTIYINGIVVDITDQKKAEEVLRRSHEDLERAVQERTIELTKSEERFKLVAQATNDAIYDWDLISGKAWLSKAHQSLFGYDEELAEFDWWKQKIHPDDLDRALTGIHDAIYEGGRIWNAEYRFRRADGSFAHIFDRGTIIRDEAGNPVRFIGSMQDVSERKRVEEDLRQSEEKYRYLAEQMADIVWTTDLEFRTTYVSPSIEKILGFTPDERKQQTLGEMVTPESLERIQAKFLEEMQREAEPTANPDRAVVLEVEYYHKDGTTLWMEITVKALRDLSGLMIGLYGICRDISERKQAEQKIHQLAAIVQSSEEAVIGKTLEGIITNWNKGAEKIYGYTEEEMIGRSISQLIPPGREDELPRIFAKIKSGEYVENFETIRLKKNGQLFPMSLTISPILDVLGRIIGVSTIGQDISERKRMEEERVIMSKLESTGILAGGIAHDFNNLLSVILGNLELAKMCKHEAETAAFLGAAEKAALEARGVTHQLITLAKGGQPIKKLTALPALLPEQVSLTLRGSLTAAKLRIADDLWPVEADESQICQVIRNIILNAREAMPDGGTISVSAENVILDTSVNTPFPSRKWVKIIISDQGGGIPERILPLIFDPYFSTKQRGTQKGMGLGLTICRSVIQKHGGFITVDTKEGEGTEVRIILPASPKENEGTSPSEGIIFETKRILVMDDEEMMRSMLGAMLTRQGYEVELVENGERAIETYQTAQTLGRPFDAVILDLTIRGGMGGAKTIQELLKIDPKVRALVCSGYDQDPVMQNYEIHGFIAALNKPFLVEDLKKILSKVIRAGQDQ